MSVLALPDGQPEMTLEEKKRGMIGHAQYFHDKYVPYRVLWVKVIIRAAYDYALWKDSKDLRLRKYALDAEKWLFEPSKLINGFESICYLFQLPKKQLQEWARDLTREQVKKFEFLERSGKDPVTLALEDTVEPDDGDDQ